MRISRVLGIIPLLVALMITGASAQMGGGFHGDMQQDQTMQQNQQIMPPSYTQIPTDHGRVAVYTGTLSSIDSSRQELYIRTQVPGLFGPQMRDVPFRVSDDTTMTICFRSLNQCESRATGSSGWSLLSSLESVGAFSSARKNVIVVSEPVTGNVVHVQIDYEI